MIFRIFRSIRRAALETGMTVDAYTLTTALACMVSSGIYLKRNKNLAAAAAMIATAKICISKLQSE